MYAMKRWLEEEGHEVKILTYDKNFDFDQSEAKKNSGSFSNIGYYIQNYLFGKGLGTTWFNTRKVLTLKKSFQEIATEPYDCNSCDAVIIGSDEVFSIDVGCNRMMYGYGLGDTPAIAYAPSFGRSTEELLREFGCYDLIKNGLSSMYALSARDEHTKKLILSMTGRDVPLVCDPVLLYNGKGFITEDKPLRRKFMVIYSYDRHMVDAEEIRAIKTYAKRHKLMTVSLGTYHSWADRNIVCNAEEWYAYFKDAECVLTDTFHGCIVSIRNHCNLAVYIRESINGFKLKSLLTETGLRNRRIPSIKTGNLEKVFSSPIDYESVNQRIEDMVAFSEAYLKGSLERVNVQ